MVVDVSTTNISCSTSSWWLRGKVIGRGSFGTVNLAVNTTDDTHIFAVKSVNRATCIPRQLESLENEIRILRSVSSPHIVRFLGDDLTREGTASYRNLHLEYMSRGTLADVAGQSLEEHLIQRFTWCLVSALRHVHTCGYVHCDVKARNVLLGEDSVPVSAKLADFGSGIKIRPGNGYEDTVLPRGSPLWMAPEVIRREYQGPESDVWSLGCTIIELVTGKPPWIDYGAETLRTIGFSDELPKFPATLSETGRNFLDRCLRRDPSERWSCDQLLQHPFISSFALPGSPRHVLDWVDDLVFDEDEKVVMVSESVSESNPNFVRDRISKLAMRGRVIWESDGWLVVRGSNYEMEEQRHLIPDSSCTEPVTVRTGSSNFQHPTWQMIKVNKITVCQNRIISSFLQDSKYMETEHSNTRKQPRSCHYGVPQNADLAAVDPTIVLLYMCCIQMSIYNIYLFSYMTFSMMGYLVILNTQECCHGFHAMASR